MAQVTISGNLEFGHESVTSQANNSAGAKTKASGMRNLSSAIRFTATEDLGNGLKATASMQMTSAGRGAANPANEDASLTLSGGFGAVTIGAVEAGNGIVGLGQAGAPVRGLHNEYNSAAGRLLAAPSNVDLLSYTSPAFSGVTVRLQMTDSVGTGGEQASAKNTIVGARYAAGPLTIDADYTDGDRNGQATSTAFQSERTRISAGYNFGVARIGYGYEKRTIFTSATASSDTTDTIMGVSVPVGAFTVGATYGTSKAGTAAKATGSEFGVKYDFSKRTALTAQMGSFKKADTSKQSITRVRLNHAF